MKAVPAAKTKRRKKLNCTEETFFLMVQLVCGVPRRDAFTFQSHDQWSHGIHGWLKFTTAGEQFTHCVTECGEAKSRAAEWYKAYSAWWRKQHGVSFEQWKKDTS